MYEDATGLITFTPSRQDIFVMQLIKYLVLFVL